MVFNSGFYQIGFALAWCVAHCFTTKARSVGDPSTYDHRKGAAKFSDFGAIFTKQGRGKLSKMKILPDLEPIKGIRILPKAARLLESTTGEKKHV